MTKITTPAEFYYAQTLNRYAWPWKHQIRRSLQPSRNSTRYRPNCASNGSPDTATSPVTKSPTPKPKKQQNSQTKIDRQYR